MEKKDFEEKIKTLKKKTPTQEEIISFEDNWIKFAKETTFSLDAQEFLLNSFPEINSSKILYKYICEEVNKVHVLNEFISNKAKKQDKTSFSKVLFGLIALMITSEIIDSNTVGHFFYESIKVIQNDKDSKKSASRYLAKYLISNLPENPQFIDFDKSGLVLYSSSSLIQDCLNYISEIEKNEIKIPEENQKRLASFKVWLLDSKKKIDQKNGDGAVEYAAGKQKEKDQKEKDQAKKQSIINSEEYQNLLKEKYSLLAEKKEIVSKLAGANSKISNLENKIVSLNYEIRNLKKDVRDRDNQIDFLNKKIEEQKQITNIVEKDESQKVQETYQQIANKLNYDYSTFKEAKDVEMSNDLGELFKEQLSNVFNVLKQVGINLE